MKKLTIVLALLLVTVTSCHKENSYSNKLMDGKSWTVKEVTVDGVSLNLTGIWSVNQGVDIEKSIPSTEWTNSNGNAIFEWQFLNKGKQFQFSYVQQANEDGEALSELDYLAYDITGEYEVICAANDLMEFSSTSTIKYSGKKVYIKVER